MSIKLIAADLDGTLLSSTRQLSPDLFPLVDELNRRGVRFAPTSGRQYYSQRELFTPIQDELMYISENGAMICDGAEIILFEAMEQDVVCRAIETTRELPGVEAVLSCRTGSFIENRTDTVFYENMARYSARRYYTEDLLTVARSEPVCKIAVYCKERAEEVLLPAFAGFAETSQMAVSGADWMDLMQPGMSKGKAIVWLCERLGIAPDECMAFGDYLNDLELLQAVGESYAMANGHEALKQAAKYICPSNDEDGVCRTIRQVLGIDKA